MTYLYSYIAKTTTIKKIRIITGIVLEYGENMEYFKLKKLQSSTKRYKLTIVLALLFVYD